MITSKTIRPSVHPLNALLSLTLLFGAASAMPATAIATGQEGAQHEHHNAMKETMQSEGMATCKAMMADREQMMEAFRAGDEKLEELLGSIRSASGDAKVDAIEATLEELVAQRRAFGTTMMQHHSSMMEKMAHPGEDGMGMCPMMGKMMSDGEGTPPETEEAVGKDEHSEHHP